MTDVDRFGALNSVVIEFPAGAVTEAGFLRLLSAVDAGSIRIIDLEFVASEAGARHILTPAEVSASVGIDLSALMDHKLAQLTQLGERRDAGILSEAKFDAKKALILG